MSCEEALYTGPESPSGDPGNSSEINQYFLYIWSNNSPLTHLNFIFLDKLNIFTRARTKILGCIIFDVAPPIFVYNIEKPICHILKTVISICDPNNYFVIDVYCQTWKLDEWLANSSQSKFSFALQTNTSMKELCPSIVGSLTPSKNVN